MTTKEIIPFTNFDDKLAPFLNVHLGKDYFKRGNFCDNETFITICHAYIDWYNENKIILIKNIKAIYALTGNETGYSAMTTDWERRRNIVGFGDVVKFDDEYIEKNLIDRMGLLMNHLYQKNSYGKECKFESRMIGLLVLHSLNVDIRLSDKRETKDVIFDFSISIHISSSNHREIECDE